jgi:hypothetical protein
MRGETWVSLGACLIGVAVPMAWVAPHLLEHPGLLPAASVVVFPFALAAGTGWVARTDRRAARVNAVVSVLVLIAGLGGWLWAAQEREGIALILVALLFVPAAQLVIWLVGAIVSGHRGRRAEPVAPDRPALLDQCPVAEVTAVGSAGGR